MGKQRRPMYPQSATGYQRLHLNLKIPFVNLKNICKQNIDKLKWNWNKDTQCRWNCFWPEKDDIWPACLPFLSHLLLGFFSFAYPLLLSFPEAAKPPAISCRDLEFISQSRAVKVLILLLRFNSPSRTDFFSLTQHYSVFIVFSDAKTFEEFR